MNRTTASRARAASGRSAVERNASHQHTVGFYDSEEFLVGTVAGFVGPALSAGDAAVVVATADHRRAFEAALRRSGVDVTAAAASGRYVSIDAAELLESFMIDGAPDPGCFADTAGRVIEQAGGGGRRVRIYGEMVALLWDTGDVVSAISLEDLWNDLSTERDFMLLCAYPMRAFEGSDSGTAFRRICDQHSTVIPSEDYAMLGGADAQQRAVASLQQQAASLKADVARLLEEQTVTEQYHAEALAARSPKRPVDRGSPGAQLGRRAPSPSRTSHLYGSPGGRLLVKSLGTLSSRIRYTD